VNFGSAEEWNITGFGSLRQDNGRIATARTGSRAEATGATKIAFSLSFSL
jgi:hypothetical protein